MLSRLRRVTRDGLWIPEVDGLRFVAIGSVFLYHMLGELAQRSGRIIPVEANYHWLEQILEHGNRGVPLFFVISGMILAMPFARHHLLGSKPISLRKYYMRRVTRLEPPYIASLVLAVLLVAVYQRGVSAEYLGHLLASMVYQHGLIFGRISPVNSVTWSLEIEIQFYLFAPLAMQVYRIRRIWLRRVLLVVTILGLGLLQARFQSWPRFNMSILYYAQYFLAGLVVAEVFVLDLEKLKSSWMWDLVGIAALVAIFGPASSAILHTLMPIAIAVLFPAAMRSRGLRRVFANEWVAVIGGMCYSIYLLHFLFIAVLFKMTRHAILPQAMFFTNYAIQLLLVMLPVLLLCAVFFVLVERPCMDPDWPSKLWHALTGHPESEVAVLDAGGISE